MSGFIIKNGYLITVDSNDRIIPNGAVVIEGNKIVAVGKTSEILDKYRSDEYTVIDASRKVIMPGLINTHAHLYQNFLKGVHDELPLKEWCDSVLFPLVDAAIVEMKEGKDDIYRYSTYSAVLESIRFGTTTLVDFAGTGEIAPEVFAETGIRGIYARTFVDRWVPEEFIPPIEKAMGDMDKLIKKWHGKYNGRIRLMYAPSAPFTCTEELLKAIREHADKTKVPVSIHLSETRYEQKLAKEEYGTTPTDWLNKIGFLKDDVLAVHGVWLNDSDLKVIKEKDVKISHNPESNMRLASGIAPVAKMLKMGITVGLATDGAASNDNLDMIEAMRGAVFSAKVSNLRASALLGYDAIKMATIWSAKALKLENEIGSIEVGKKADVILINLDALHLKPVYDPINTIVYVATGHDVDTVIIDGKLVMHNRRILTVDEDLISQKIDKVYQEKLEDVYKKIRALKVPVESEDIEPWSW
ncbi:MAG: amidohydrolase family protein [Candidatus Asgardarchaeia archaeon]